MAESRQIGGVVTFFETLGSKKYRKSRCVFHLRSPKPRYSQCFLLMVAKNHGIFSVFGQHRKTTGILRSFRHVARRDFFMQKSQNPCKSQYLGSEFRVCDVVEPPVYFVKQNSR